MIKVYKQEMLDGLEKSIASNMTIAYVTQANLFTPSTELATKIRAYVSGSANPNQLDLAYLNSVLASIGWNANDDVFDKQESFIARATPIDKPFNFMHNEADIIGHITGSSILAEGKVIANTEEMTDIPDKFDILTEAVIYKTWSDKTLQERMDRLLAEIAEGKWFVSMECLFSNFDYAVITPQGEHKIVARNETSAFLTKHLRAYGGSGSFEDNKIGRLLRNFAFSGKGLVDNPANKRSIIFTDINKFAGTSASAKIFTKGKLMDEVLKAQLEETKRLLAEVQAENKNLQTKAREEADKAVSKQLETLTTTLTAKEEAVKAANKLVEDAVAAKTAAETALATEKERVSVLSTEITAMKAEAAKAARLAKLTVAGVTGDEATKLMEKFATATEEMFDEIVAMKSAAKFPADKFKKDDKNDNDNDDDDKKAKSATDTTVDDKGEKAAAATDVDKLKTEEANLAAGGTDKTAELRAAASSWISKNVLKSTAKLNK